MEMETMHPTVDDEKFVRKYPDVQPEEGFNSSLIEDGVRQDKVDMGAVRVEGQVHTDNFEIKVICSSHNMLQQDVDRRPPTNEEKSLICERQKKIQTKMFFAFQNMTQVLTGLRTDILAQKDVLGNYDIGMATADNKKLQRVMYLKYILRRRVSGFRTFSQKDDMLSISSVETGKCM